MTNLTFKENRYLAPKGIHLNKFVILKEERHEYDLDEFLLKSKSYLFKKIHRINPYRPIIQRYKYWL